MGEHEDAARRRADYLRALREERDGYARTGKTERAAEVQREIDRAEGRPVGRSETPTEPKAPRRHKSTATEGA